MERDAVIAEFPRPPEASHAPKLRDLLVHLDSSPRSAARLDLAIQLARRHRARLTGLFAESATRGRGLVGRRDPDLMHHAVRDVRAAFEARATEAGVACRFWQVEPGEHAQVLRVAVVCCRYVDLVVYGQRDADGLTPPGLLEHVIAEGGRPVLVVPATGRHDDVGRRVLVAWTGSREATRMLHDALPLLAAADEVIVLSLQLPGSEERGGTPPVDVVDHLRTHGISARHLPTILGAAELAADAVLNRASDELADLTLMGAFGMSGGTLLRRAELTRAVLGAMTTPLLLSA
jgi:nucleotide-binding universal stress UspA family protein